MSAEGGGSPALEDFDALYDAVRARTGLDLREYKQDQLRRRLRTWAEARGDRTFGTVAQRVAKCPAEMRELFERVAINVSELYRNPERWADLERKILPGLARRVSALKCWSAGCSFGAEAHTLAAVLESAGSRYRIVGTDIDEDALESARRGRFDAAAMRGVPTRVRDRFFLEDGDAWQAKPELRHNLRFRAGNLLNDRFEREFDLILCRNVAIYFTDAAKDRLYRKFYQALRPGGVLFVGGTERVFDARDIGYEAPLPFFYRKPENPTLREEPQPWRNAS